MAILLNINGDVQRYDVPLDDTLPIKIKHMLRSLVDSTYVPSLYPTIYTANSQADLDIYLKKINDYLTNDDEFEISEFTWKAKLNQTDSGEFVLIFLKDGIEQRDLTFYINKLINIKTELPTSFGLSCQLQIVATDNDTITINNKLINPKLFYIGNELPNIELIILNPLMANASVYNITDAIISKVRSAEFSIISIKSKNANIIINESGIIATKINESSAYILVKVEIARNGFRPSFINTPIHKNIKLNGKLANNNLIINSPNIIIGNKYFISIISNRTMEHE